jgi:hypothetical protein
MIWGSDRVLENPDMSFARAVWGERDLLLLSFGDLCAMGDSLAEEDSFIKA